MFITKFHSVTFHIYNNDGNVKKENKWYLQFIYVVKTQQFDTWVELKAERKKEINKTKPPTIFDQFNANLSKEKISKSSV